MSADNVYQFQELVRIIDATLANVNREGLANGQNAMKVITFLSSFEGMDKFLPEGYQEYIREQTMAATGKGNARGEVKNMLMYPELKYSPWTDVEFDTSDIDVSSVQFKIQLVDGKVYAKCVSVSTVSDLLYQRFVKDNDNNLSPNSEPCHITLVNSNVVYDLGQEKVQAFLNDNFQDQFTVKLGHVKTTFSRDYSLFGSCYVVEVHSPILKDFIDKFSTFKVIKPTTHITFAIQPRDLMAKMSITH